MQTIKQYCQKLFALTVFATASMLSYADDISVAVAANFSEPFKEIISQYEKQSSHKVKASYGSSGGFYTQITNGAPFQIFLSADSTRPEKLVTEQAAVKGTDFIYAKGKLALWSADAKKVDSAGKVLTNSAQYTHLSIANPSTAPYGAAAVQTLQKLGLYESIKSKIVTADNIGQAYQFTVSGNAEIGFVALSQIYKDGKVSSGSAWIVPSSYYSAIEQKAVLLNQGANSKAVQDFYQFLKSNTAKQIIKKYGYEL